MSEETSSKKMSAAAFFNENRAIAGFGNTMRAVFTSIRELVENGLDAAEKRGVNPEIYVELRKLSSDEINRLLDVKQHKTLEKHLDFLQLTCRDNGVGVPGHLIPELFGRVLTGTKYGVIQTRGRFGLGAKMCLLYSMSTVDLPARIKSRYFMDEITYEVALMIDLERNEPIIMEQHEYLPGDPNYMEEPGTEITITFTGAWNLAKNNVKEYFKQLAIITPYASFHVKLPGDKDEYEILEFQRVVDDMPPPPKPIKIHPWGCDITQFKAELSATNCKTLKEFLATHFMGVTEEVAEDFFQLLEIDPNKDPKTLTSSEIRRIVHEGFVKAYQEAKEVKRKRDRIFQFDPPKGSALSPLGAARLRKGLEKELQPQFVEAISRPPKAYSGHPFIVEAAIGYGGGVTAYAQSKGTSDNKIIYRYANRIPLIFGAGNDVITHVVNSIKWNEYGLTKQSDPLAIAVSIVSTKIPFPETSKEYIASVPEIEEEIRLALMQLGRRLKTFLTRARRRKREHVRLSRFVRSAPVVAENLIKILADERIKFGDLQNETNRLAAALAHGIPKPLRLFKPLGARLYSANVWCPNSVKSKLEKSGILTTGEFLYTPADQLVNIINYNEDEIIRIKYRTLYELDREGLSPSIELKILVTPFVEKRFTKPGEKGHVSLQEALYRRWIQNTYHYLATENEKLYLVHNLLEKLFENKKYELLQQLKDLKATEPTTLDSFINDEKPYEREVEKLTSIKELKLPVLFPSFSYIKSKLEFVHKSTTVEEFLFQLRKPLYINYNKDLTTLIISYVKEVFSALIEKFPEFADETITKMSVDWIDGYTKNAFHRRKISTVKDFISYSTEELAEIKELERSLHNTIIELLAEKEKSFSLSQLSLTKVERINEGKLNTVIQELKTNGITTLSKLIVLPVSSVRQERFMSFADFLLEESKIKLISSIQEKQRDLDLSHIKIIPEKAEKNLNANQIFTTTEFVSYPSKKLIKMGLNQRLVSQIKNSLGTQIPKWLESYKELKKNGILCLEELFYNSFKELELPKECKAAFINDVSILRAPLIFVLPEIRQYSHLLYELGINCLGRFLIWPNDELSKFMDLPIEQIEKIKRALSPKSLNVLKDKLSYNFSLLSRYFPKLSRYFGDKLTLLEAYYYYEDEDVKLDLPYWKKLEKITSILNQDITELIHVGITKSSKSLQTIREALLKLKIRNISTIRQFLIIPKEVLEATLTSSRETKLLLQLREAIEQENVPENSFNENLTLASEFIGFKQLMDLPISRVKGFELEDIEKLRVAGIVAIHQLFEYVDTELAEILGKTRTFVKNIFSNFVVDKEGQPFFEKTDKGKYRSLVSFEFEELERFSPQEIESLVNSGYTSIDQIFFLTHPLSFATPVVNWDVIDKFKRLLRSPLTIISWEKKVKKKVKDEETGEEKEIEVSEYHTLSTKELKDLRNNGISRIIDLLLSKTEKLAEILQLDLEQAEKLKRDIRITDVGIELAELDIFKPEIVKILENNDIVTIEDLYFSTSRKKWNIKSIPWSLIERFKKILNLSLNNLSDLLDEDFIEQLKKVEVQTLLGFLLSSPESLMKKTGIPDERIENIKSGLNIGEIYYYFSLPIYYLPKLNFEQTELLRKNGIKTIIDFLMATKRRINKILELGEKEIGALQKSLTIQTIQEVYEERGIYASEIKLFDRAEQKQLARESIFEFECFQTVQELFYTEEIEYYLKDSPLYNKVEVLRKYLELPLKLFVEISDYSISILKKQGIESLYQLLFIPDVEISDNIIYRTVSLYSSRFMNMRALHYLTKLPGYTYNYEYYSKIVDDIENKSLVEVITNKDVISDLLQQSQEFIEEKYNIRIIKSVLELPLKITPFYETLPPDQKEQLKETKIGDIFDIEGEDKQIHAEIKKLIQHKNSLNTLLSQLSIPIVSIGLPTELALRLSKTPITTLIHFYSTPIKELSEISNFSMKALSQIRDSFNYNAIIDYQQQHSHNLKADTILTNEEIEKLKTVGINDIEKLYFAGKILGATKILGVKKYRKFRELFAGSIRFIGFLSNEEIKKLEFHSIRSIIDLALLSKDKLCEITNNEIYREYHILDLISLEDLEEKRKVSAIPLTQCKSISEDYLEKLNEIGIFSIQDFLSRLDEIREQHPQLVKTKVFSEIMVYESSVAFLDLPLQYTLKLIYSGIGDIISFLTEDQSTIAIVLGTDEKEVNKIVRSVNPNKILKAINSYGLSLDKVNYFSKTKIKFLMRAKKELIQDLYSLYYQAGEILDVPNEHLDDFISFSHSSLYRIKELDFEYARELAKNGILRVIDLILAPLSELTKIFGKEKARALKELIAGEFTLTKGTAFSLNEPMRKLLTDINIVPKLTYIEDIFGFNPLLLLSFSEAQRIELAPNVALAEQIIAFLSSNILVSPSFDIETKKKLWESNINCIIDLFSANCMVNEKLAKTIVNTIKEYRKEYPITKRMSETFSPFAELDEKKAFVLPDFLMRLGLNHPLLAFNLLPHPMFSLKSEERDALINITNTLYKPISLLIGENILTWDEIRFLYENKAYNVLSAYIVLYHLSEDNEHKRILTKIDNSLKNINIEELTLEESKIPINNLLLPGIEAECEKEDLTHSEIAALLSIFSENWKLGKALTKSFEFLSTLPLNLLENQNGELKELLVKNGIKTLDQLLLLPEIVVNKAFGNRAEVILKLRDRINVADLYNYISAVGLKLSLIEKIEEKDIEKLNEKGIFTLFQLLSAPELQKHLDKKVRKALTPFVSYIFLPISLLCRKLKLSIKEENNLESKGITTYYDLISISPTSWPEKLQKVLEQARKSQGYMLEMLKDCLKYGTEIAKLKISTSALNTLYQLGYKTIEQVYYLPLEKALGINKTVEKEILKIREIVKTNVCYLPMLSKEDIITLYEEKIFDIYTFLTSAKTLTSKLKDKIIQTLTGTMDLNDYTTFHEPLGKLEQEAISEGYSSIKSILIDPYIKTKPLYKEIIGALSLNISSLNIDSKVKTKFKQNGITTVTDLIVLSPTYIASKTRVGLAKIKSILNNLRLSELQKLYEGLKNKHKSTSLSFLASEEIELLVNYGIFSSNDLAEFSIYPWLVEEKKLTAIKNRRKALYNISILYVPDITKNENIASIKKKFFEQGIFTADDYLAKFTVGDEEKRKIIMSIGDLKTLKDDYLAVDKFVDPQEINNLFDGIKIKLSDIKTVVDLYITLYRNHDSLSTKGVEALELLEQPITILNINHATRLKLFEANIHYVIDVGLTPLTKLEKIIKVEPSKLLSSYSLSKLHAERQKGIKVSELSILNAELKNAIKQNKIEYMDKLIIDLAANSDLLPKQQYKQLVSILNTDSYDIALKGLTLNNWLSFVTKVKNLKDLFLFTLTELSNILKLKENEIKQIIKSLTVQHLLKPLPLKENLILTREDIVSLKELKIKNYTALMRTNAIKPGSKLTQLKIDFIRNFDISALDKRLKVKLSLGELFVVSRHIDILNDKERTKAILEFLLSYLSSKGLPLANIIYQHEEKGSITSSITAELYALIKLHAGEKHEKLLLSFFTPEEQSLLKKMWNYFARYLPILLPEIIEKLENLKEVPITRIYEMLLPLKSPEKGDQLLKTIIKLRKSLTLKELEEKEKSLIRLDIIVKNEEEIKLLNRIGIYTVEELLFYDKFVSEQKGKVAKIIRQLIELLHLSIYILPCLTRSRSYCTLTLEKGVSTVYELFRACKTNEISTEICAEIRKCLVVEKLTEIKEQEYQRLEKYIDLNSELEKLKELKITSLGELIATTILTPIGKLPSTLTAILSYLRLPIEVLTLTKGLMKSLNKQGYYQIADLLLSPSITEALKDIINEKEATALNELTDKLTLSQIQENYLNKLYPIQKLAFIDNEIKASLQRAGYTTVAHLLLSTNIISKQTLIKEREIQKIHDLLQTPIYLLPELVRNNVHAIFDLQKLKIHTLMDLLLADLSVVAKEIGMAYRQLSNWLSSLSKQSLIIAKKELVPIRASLPHINDNDVTVMKKQGYEYLQQLATLSKSEKKKKVFASPNIQQLLLVLEQPIDRLNISDKDVKTCLSLNIETVKDFVLYPASLLESKLSLNYTQIKKLKSSLKLIEPVKVKKKVKAKTETKPEVTTTIPTSKKTPAKTSSKVTSTKSKKKPTQSQQKSTSRKSSIDKKATSAAKKSSSSSTSRASKKGSTTIVKEKASKDSKTVRKGKGQTRKKTTSGKGGKR